MSKAEILLCPVKILKSHREKISITFICHKDFQSSILDHFPTRRKTIIWRSKNEVNNTFINHADRYSTFTGLVISPFEMKVLAKFRVLLECQCCPVSANFARRRNLVMYVPRGSLSAAEMFLLFGAYTVVWSSVNRLITNIPLATCAPLHLWKVMWFPHLGCGSIRSICRVSFPL